MISKLVKVARNPSLIIPAVMRRFQEMGLSRTLFTSMFRGSDEMNTLRQELEASGILRELDRRIRQFDEVKDSTVRGQAVGSGVMSCDEGIALFLLVRKLAPDIVVETGVCSGYSSALILKAMELNDKGRLYSIDFPEILGEESQSCEFWEGKGSAVIPPNKKSGWLIPESLRERWVLKLGKTQDLLEPLLEELGSIDIFIHDSEHSYECMMFEYCAAWKVLRRGGLLVSDDIGWNKAFFDFAREVQGKPGKIVGNMGFIVRGD